LSRCGVARCDLWLGRFSEAAAALDVCMLDSALLGSAPRVLLALALFFGGDQRAMSVARQSVDERALASPSEQVVSLMVLQVITGDADVLRRAFPLLGLSANAKDGILSLSRNLSFLVFALCAKGDVRALTCAKFQLDLVERLDMIKSSSDYCHAIFGFAWAQSLLPELKPAACRTLEELQRTLETTFQSRAPVYGRTILLLGTLLVEMERARDAVGLLKVGPFFLVFLGL
jgi:hypothetical protein